MNLFACQMQAGYIWISDRDWEKTEALFQNLVGGPAFYCLYKIHLKGSILNELETCKGLIWNILQGQEPGVRHK